MPRHRRRRWASRAVPLAALALLAGMMWVSSSPQTSVASADAAHRPVSSATLAALVASRENPSLSRSGGSRVLTGTARVEAIEARAEKIVHHHWKREAARKRAAERRQERIEARQWGPPLTRYHITASFGESSSLWSSAHTGVDLDSTTGTPVHPVGPGRVTFAGYDGSYGNKVVVRHSDGSRTWYCHLSAINVGVGDSVTHDMVVGLVGATGNVTGDHLHLELHPAGQKTPVDPVPGLLAAHGVHL